MAVSAGSPPTPVRLGVGPDGVAYAFAQALLGGDAQAAVAYFDPGGVLLTADGTEVSGRAAIAAVLDQVTSSSVELGIRLGRTLQAGSVALSTQFWRRRGEGFEQASTATFVLAEANGRWAIRIASPWG